MTILYVEIVLVSSGADSTDFGHISGG